jgi:transposase
LRRRGAIGDDSRVDADLDSAAFPDDAAHLRALLAERDAAIAERDAALAERDALLNARFEIEKLKVQLAALRRERYGKSSERLAAEIGQLEMLIGDLEEDQAERAAAAEKARRAKRKSDTPRQPAVRRPLPEHLPRGSKHCFERAARACPRLPLRRHRSRPPDPARRGRD